MNARERKKSTKNFKEKKKISNITTPVSERTCLECHLEKKNITM
jgi:hypothetical protein